MKTVQPEIHILPKDYRGEVIIRFNQASGEVLKYENEAILFEINSDGTLNTTAPPNIGIRPEDTAIFYSIDENEERQKIPHFKEKGLHPTDVVVSDLYVVNQNFHYFVDRLENISNYKNPGLVPSERDYE